MHHTNSKGQHSNNGSVDTNCMLRLNLNITVLLYRSHIFEKYLVAHPHQINLLSFTSPLQCKMENIICFIQQTSPAAVYSVVLVHC